MIARVVGKALNTPLSFPPNGGDEGGEKLEGITQVGTMEEAVEAAAGLVRSGDVVLLSPGGTSFDAFQDFTERGDRFKDLVRDL